MLYAMWETEQGFSRHECISNMLHGYELKDIPNNAVIIEAESLMAAEDIYDDTYRIHTA